MDFDTILAAGKWNVRACAASRATGFQMAAMVLAAVIVVFDANEFD